MAKREKCDRCNGTGTAIWGAIVNGKPTHSGTCYRCQGKGLQTEADKRRNYGYDCHAAVRAFRGGR